MTSTPNQLEVFVHQQPVGLLHIVQEQRIRFTPNSQWLSSEQQPNLGLSFLNDPRPRTGNEFRRLPIWFENLLPERKSKLRSWMCKQFEIQERDSMSLIAKLGNDLVGAVRVVGLTDQSLENETDDDQTASIPLRFSLAGMQLKLSMVESGDRFAFPARNKLGSWIIKLPGTDFPDLPEVEAATMAWARATGLATPNFRVEDIENLEGVDHYLTGGSRTFFAIERFDRVNGQRLHQEDFAQAMEFWPEEKYGASNRGFSYERLTKLVLDTCGTSAAEDFIDRVAFTVACGNGDAHLKNWSFQWKSHNQVRLSPCYDFVSTICWSQFGWSAQKGPELALSFAKKRRFREIDLKVVNKFAESTQVDNATDRFLDALKRAKESWSAVLDVVPERMRSSIREHWSQVPLLASLGAPPAF